MYFSRPKPLFYLGKFPIGTVELILILEILGALILAFTQNTIAPQVVLSSEAILGGKLWTILTYTFFSEITFFWLVGLFFFYQFGRMVENDLGRTSFLSICGISVLTPPVIIVLYTLTGLPGSSAQLLGSSVLHLAVFCSFCVMFPNLPTLLLQVKIKWLGLAFFLVTIVQFISLGWYNIVLATIITTALSLIIVQSKGKAIIKLFPDSWAVVAPAKKPPKRRPSKSTKPKRTYTSKLKPKSKVTSETEIDAILDKISEHGLHSLTEEERQTLQNTKK